jgi:hypothetical protein
MRAARSREPSRAQRTNAASAAGIDNAFAAEISTMRYFQEFAGFQGYGTAMARPPTYYYGEAPQYRGRLKGYPNGCYYPNCVPRAPAPSAKVPRHDPAPAAAPAPAHTPAPAPAAPAPAPAAPVDAKPIPPNPIPELKSYAPPTHIITPRARRAMRRKLNPRQRNPRRGFLLRKCCCYSAALPSP